MFPDSPPKKTEAEKKPGAPVEIEVEVLGPEGGEPAHRGASGANSSNSANSSNAQSAAPRGAGPDWTGFGKSPAFREMASLAVGLAADALEVAFPPAWLVVDAFATVAFFLIWGLRWEIAVVLLPELVPGMNVFPSWTLLAMYLKKKDAGNR